MPEAVTAQQLRSRLRTRVHEASFVEGQTSRRPDIASVTTMRPRATHEPLLTNDSPISLLDTI